MIFSSTRTGTFDPRVGAAVVCVTMALILCACGSPGSDGSDHYDRILRGGTIYDGSGAKPIHADLAIRGDRIAAIGSLEQATADEILDVDGLAVAPGFVNMLSWSTESLIVDGKAQSEIRQGVTLQVMGEGVSMGPVNDRVREFLVKQRPPEIDFEIDWTSLGGYLDHLVERGVAPNVASFVGATTLRIHVIGFDDRPPNDEELKQMRALVGQAMEQGALGVGSALIYAPAFYAETGELVALMEEAARHGGMYISHLRSEGDRLLEAADELIAIARRTGAPAEIYHLKAAGRDNWDKLEQIIDRVEAARAEGLKISADIYTYPAAATGLDAAMPLWVQEGGYEAWAGRMGDPEIRRRVAREMRAKGDDWENLYLAAGPEKMLLTVFHNPELRHLSGKSLAEVAAERGVSAEETAMDLVIEDGSRVGTVYFVMSEENVRRKVALPWVSFGSDEAAQAPEGLFLKFKPHPRAYGTFARVLGRYVRDEGVLSLEQAVHKLSGLPATNLGLDQRGFLRDGYFADVVVFDPRTVRDHATFEDPHRYATGVVHVLVNGEPVLLDGEQTGALPGRVVRGPGWTGGSDEKR